MGYTPFPRRGSPPLPQHKISPAANDSASPHRDSYPTLPSFCDSPLHPQTDYGEEQREQDNSNLSCTNTPLVSRDHHISPMNPLHFTCRSPSHSSESAQDSYRDFQKPQSPTLEHNDLGRDVEDSARHPYADWVGDEVSGYDEGNDWDEEQEYYIPDEEDVENSTKRSDADWVGHEVGDHDECNDWDEEQEYCTPDEEEEDVEEQSMHLAGETAEYEYHPDMNGVICDAHGQCLPENTPPPPETRSPDDWAPFNGRAQFELADFLYRRDQMSAGHIDTLLRILAAANGSQAPFADHRELYDKIDSIEVGEAPWDRLELQYAGELPQTNVPPWMTTRYEVWYRDPCLLVKNILSNPDFRDGIDYAPYRVNDCHGDRIYHNFMSGDWAWNKAECLKMHPKMKGAMIVPIILGSDKTTTSIATGDSEYYPLYLSIGNLHNNVRRAHSDAVTVVAFLAIAKTTRQHRDDESFRRFRRQLLQSSLAAILESLEPGMTKPEVLRCPDGHYRRATYCIGPYIADYPEQAVIASIVNGWCAKCMAESFESKEPGLSRTRAHTEMLVRLYELGELWENYGLVGDIEPFTNSFPGADIHELIAPDILHQIVKGVFKDHLVTWVEEYLNKCHGRARARKILDEIDYKISIAPPFTALRRFPQGRGFKQWTGADSKALMKLYLSAIVGHVPREVVRTFRALLEFCYIIRQEYITKSLFDNLTDALARFHENRTIFQDTGVRRSFELPRQHAIVHYPRLIKAFGAPNGLCTSITESQHIRSVKEPWRRSNRNNPLAQMLTVNTRISKLVAVRNDFKARRMLTDEDSPLLNVDLLNVDSTMHRAEQEEATSIVEGPTTKTHVGLAKTRARSIMLTRLAHEAQQPDLQQLVQQFLQDQMAPDTVLRVFDECVDVFNSAIAIVHAPSDPSGVGGMRREFIRAVSSWRGGLPRYDCAFFKSKANPQGMLMRMCPCSMVPLCGGFPG
ncbi:hypothetical protein AX17_004928 [Amanita inopinata Kibby_2008]|nr:hypothetical protein AX17_004928 [Amanita inopinata Kibby_2008]